MKKNQLKIKGELDLQVDKQVVAKDKHCTRILEISITPPIKSAEKTRKPLNLSLVLDRSGSMSGEKLHYVKKAALHIIDLLDEEDRASVVIYDDEIDTIVSPGNLTDEFKKQARNMIRNIRSGNSTNLSGGWLRGCELVASGANDTTINRTLLLTDGLANVGITDIDQLATHARELFRRGVSTSCFGAGMGYDEHLLEAMSNSGGGNFYFLETLNAIPVVFEREFKELADIALRDVEVSIQMPEGVKAYVLAGWPVETKNGRMKIALGNLYSGRTQKIYLRLEFKKGLIGSEILIPVKVHGKDDENYVNESVETIKFQLVSAKEEASLPVNQSLMERYAEVDLADKANEALQKERAGDRQGAAKLMQSTVDYQMDYLSVDVKNKYDHLSNELSVGMSEESRKRHHRDEYENKRGRLAERDYHVQMVNGHLIAQIEGKSVLIDTGIPISIGKQPEFFFLNRVHTLSQEYMGVTLDYLDQFVGTKIDILLGMDILKKHFLTIDLPGKRITFSPRCNLQLATWTPMTDFMGIPIASFTVDGMSRKMYIDTGAKLSYVEKRIAANYTNVGKEKDFYPGLGEFETEVFEIPFQFAGKQFQLRCGILPATLETAMLVTGKSGIIGSELYQQFLVCLGFPEGAVHLADIR